MPTPYDGTQLPPQYSLLGANISTNTDHPSDFDYFKSTMKSFNTPFVDFLRDERGDTSINPHQPTFFGNPPYNHASTTWHTRPASKISKTLTSTTSLSFSNRQNGYLETFKLAFKPGTYEIDSGEAFSVYSPNKVVIGAAPNSGATYVIPVTFFDVVGFTGATGVTDSDLFRLRVLTGVTGLDEPLVATGSYAMFDREYLKFLDAITDLGFTAGNPGASGASGATFGFLTSLLGAYEVVSNGWSGNSSFTLEVPHMYSKGISGSPLGIPYGFSSTGITSATIYTTVFRVKNEDGFLFADAGTNVYIGTDGLDPIVIVNDAPGVTLSNYTTDQLYSNCTGIHTLGKLTVGPGVVFRDFPTAILSQGASRVKVDGAIMGGNYIAVNAKESAVVNISDAVINRNVFGVVAQDGGHVNFVGAVAGVSTPTILARNGAVAVAAIDGGSTRIANVVVRESPALIGFEANSVKIDSMVSDVPAKWLGTFGTTGGTANVLTVDSGTSGPNFSVFVANTKLLVKEPSPTSSQIYAVGPSEIPDIRLLGGDIRVETANQASFGLSASTVLSQTTRTRATTESKFVKSTVQKLSSNEVSAYAPAGSFDP